MAASAKNELGRRIDESYEAVRTMVNRAADVEYREHGQIYQKMGKCRADVFRAMWWLYVMSN